MPRIFAAAALVTALLAAAVAPAGADQKPAIDKSDNVKHVAQVPYDGGSELSASGRYVYTGEANAEGGGGRNTAPKEGGLHIFDVKKMKEVGFLHCPGTDNDVEVVKPGLVAMAFSGNMCVPATGGGMMLIDVKNPAKPKIISSLTTGSSHTFTPFPGGKYIYMNGGNFTGTASRRTIIVDVSNPKKPKLAEPDPGAGVMDCHDLSFSLVEEDRQLGLCAGALGTGEVQIWDVSDPLAPSVISRIINPAIQYSHYAIANSDGTLLAIDDEAFVAHDCNTGHSPTGRVWIYDITNPQVPLVQSSFAPPRGGNPEWAGIGNDAGWVGSWCMSHGLDWHPKKDAVAVTWFTGGLSVIDLSNPLVPTEAAWFMAEDSASYSTLWHAGHLFSNDHMRGLDVLKIKGF